LKESETGPAKPDKGTFVSARQACADRHVPAADAIIASQMLGIISVEQILDTGVEREVWRQFDMIE
jgi:hypothetical protein